MITFIVIAFFVVFAIAAILSHKAKAERREALQALALKNGLSFVAEQDSTMDERYGEFAVLHRGDRRYAFNQLRGKWDGRDMVGFDYHYQTYSKDNKGRRRTHHHYFSAVIIASVVPLKPLLIRPEGFFDKVTEFFGADDIDFESAEFSRKFFVKSPDRKWAFDVLHARTMEFLMTQPMFQVQFAADRVMIWRETTFAVEDFAAAVGVVDGVLDRFPDYLVRQQMEA